eukprot:2790373-Pleurochrysis_carterae.AAC.1
MGKIGISSSQHQLYTSKSKIALRLHLHIFINPLFHGQNHALHGVLVNRCNLHHGLIQLGLRLGQKLSSIDCIFLLFPPWALLGGGLPPLGRAVREGLELRQGSVRHYDRQ